MFRKLPKITAVILALIMAVAMVTACNKTADTGTQTDEPVAEFVPPTVDSTSEPEVQPEPEVVKVDVPLVVAEGDFSQRFSPFFYESEYDGNVMDMTQLGTMLWDRSGSIVWNGIEGETRSYNGVDYFYQGTSNLYQNYDEATDQTTYRIKIREDLVFSDGKPVTADDMIFTYYVFLDPTYTGLASMYSNDIVGLDAYRNQFADVYAPVADEMIAAGPDHEWTEADAWTKEIQDAFWAEIHTAWISVCQAIMDVCATSYIGYYEGDFGDITAEDIQANPDLQAAWAMYLWCGNGDVEIKDDGTVIFTGTETGRTWDLAAGESPTIEDFYQEALVGYGDVDTFGGIEDPDGRGNFIGPAKATAIRDLAVADTGGQMSVPNIEGIKKIGTHEIEIITNGLSAIAMYDLLSIPLAPMHYYGDPALYDYDNNMFGFPFSDLSIVKSKTTAPMGAGPFKFIKYENETVYYEANPLYYKGEPETKYLQLKAAPSSEYSTGIVSGTHDQANISFSTTERDYIKAQNSNGELTGDVITTSMVDNPGYGYIALNSWNTSVNNDRGSDASKNLRKALATILAVHRDTSVYNYYEDTASVINYPVSNTRWSAPKPLDDGYEIAFAKDVNGAPIYTTDMAPDVKYEAARQAALGYFEAAGFTVQDGKVVAGPADSRPTKRGPQSYLEYEAYIPGNGTGNHPSFACLTDAAESLAMIGITLTIVDPSNADDMWKATDSETADIWCAAWGGGSVDPDNYQMHFSGNIIGAGGNDGNKYGFADTAADELIIAARKSLDVAYRKALYKQVYDIILDWAVEIPVYQRMNFQCFSTQRIDISTLTPMITTMWDWNHDLEKLQMVQ